MGDENLNEALSFDYITNICTFYREKQELMQERDEAVSSQEKRILDAAFLEEERDDAVRLAAQRWRTLEELNAKLITERQEKDDYRVRFDCIFTCTSFCLSL